VNDTVEPKCADVPLRIYSLTHLCVSWSILYVCARCRLWRRILWSSSSLAGVRDLDSLTLSASWRSRRKVRGRRNCRLSHRSSAPLNPFQQWK